MKKPINNQFLNKHLFDMYNCELLSDINLESRTMTP